MRKFFNALWEKITFPFRRIWYFVTWPHRKVHSFLNAEPEEHSIADTVSGIVQDEEIREQFWAQVEALRSHLFRILIGLIITVSTAFIFSQRLIDYLAQPVGGLSALKSIEVTESVGVFMRVALLAGVAIAMPYIAFEFWLFFAPGLKPRSKKFGLAGIPLATLLFTSGMAFSYYVMMPTALPFLLNFMGIQAELRPQSYYNFVTGLMFWIGVAFQFPLIIYVLSAVGVIKPKVLAKQWRIAIVLIAIVAAAITPTVDPVNMALVMIPMSMLYFISIGLSYIAYRGRVHHEQEQKTAQELE